MPDQNKGNRGPTASIESDKAPDGDTQGPPGRVVTIDIVPFQLIPTIWKVNGHLKSCMKKTTNAPDTKKKLQFSKRVHIRYYLSRPLVEYKGIRKLLSNLKGKFPVRKGRNSTSSRRFKRTDTNFIPSRLVSMTRRLNRLGESLTR